MKLFRGVEVPVMAAIGPDDAFAELVVDTAILWSVSADLLEERIYSSPNSFERWRDAFIVRHFNGLTINDLDHHGSLALSQWKLDGCESGGSNADDESI